MKLLNKLLSVDTVDAVAGLGYVGAGAVTMLPDTTMTILGTGLEAFALPVSLGAVGVAYATNRPTFDFSGKDALQQKIMAGAAASAAAIPLGVEYIAEIGTAVADPLVGGGLFGASFIGYGIVAGLHSDDE